MRKDEVLTTRNGAQPQETFFIKLQAGGEAVASVAADGTVSIDWPKIEAAAQLNEPGNQCVYIARLLLAARQSGRDG